MVQVHKSHCVWNGERNAQNSTIASGSVLMRTLRRTFLFLWQGGASPNQVEQVGHQDGNRRVTLRSSPIRWKRYEWNLQKPVWQCWRIRKPRHRKRRDPVVALLPAWKALARVKGVHRVKDQVKGLSFQLDTSCRNNDKLNDLEIRFFDVEVA